MRLRTAATPAHVPSGCPHHSRLSFCPFSSSPLLSLWFATHRQRTQRDEEPRLCKRLLARRKGKRSHNGRMLWPSHAVCQVPGPADPPMEPPDLDRDGCCGRVPSWFFSLLPGHQQCCSLFPDRLDWVLPASLPAAPT